jgi:hypothetical protein
MCYSSEVSLATFSIGLGFSILLIFNKDPFHKLIGFFLGFVSFMQFIEYLLWNHQVCDDYNKNVSIAGMLLNHLQPVVLAFITGLIYKKNIHTLFVISLVYLSVIIPYSLQYTSDIQCSTKQCSKTDPHLVWNWNTMKYTDIVYIIFLAAFVGIALYGMPFPEGILFSSVSVLTYVSSILLYDRKVVGSMWCFWTAFFPAIMYLTNLIPGGFKPKDLIQLIPR